MISYKQWKKEKGIEHLRLKKDKLEISFKEAYEELVVGLEKGSYSMDILSDFMFVFPSQVTKEFDKFMKIDKKKLKDVKFALYDVNKSMKNELIKIDKEIENKIF